MKVFVTGVGGQLGHALDVSDHDVRHVFAGLYGQGQLGVEVIGTHGQVGDHDAVGVFSVELVNQVLHDDAVIAVENSPEVDGGFRRGRNRAEKQHGGEKDGNEFLHGITLLCLFL